MFPHKRLKFVAVAALLLIVAAACGQKPGVNQLAGNTLGAGFVPPEGTELDAEGNLINSDTGEVLATAEELAEGPTLAGGDTGDTTGITGDGGTNDGATGNDPSDPGDDPGEDPATSGGGTTTGVSDSTIKIGIHAPITGAAPVPSASFQRGKDLYWNWLKSNNKSIHGRTVQTVFRNDNYNPSQAVSGCREMVEKEKVFLLVGIAGTDQIQACARYAASVGVPYISAGVTEIGLEGLRNYFAVWMSYKQQGPLLADMLVDKLGAKSEKNGMIRFATPLFQDAHDAFIAGMKQKGAPVQYDRTVPKTAGQSEAATIATELNQQGIENVYVLTSPTFFLYLANAAAGQGYRPQWTGVGLSMAIDTVASVGCKNSNSIANARFLNPFPAYVNSNQFDPDFRTAGGNDDIQFGLWGVSKVLGGMFENAGKNLSREGLILANEKLRNMKTGVYPPVSFTASDHFGGSQMHLNRADCPNGRWVTEQAFVSDF
ncbi:MAG: ABC transporter substrate-binding protein [Actinomycetota bacterium]